MKKTISIALSCVLVLCAFTACTTEIVNDNSSQAEEYSSSLPSAESVDNGGAQSSEEESALVSTDISEESADQSKEEIPQYTSGNYLYTLTNNVAKLTKYIGTEEELTLPSDIDGYALTAIDANAFSESEKLKRLIVSDTVVNIAEGTLKGCASLEYLELGSSVAVFTVADLFDLSLLEEVAVNKANAAFSSQKGLLYNGDASVLLLCPRGLEAESLSLPQSLTKIEQYAFAECTGIGKVTVPAGCALSEYAFFHCTSLTGIELPTTLETIPQKCFFGCVKLKEITVPEGVSTIGVHAYFGCVAVSKLSLPSTITEIGEDAFKCCSALKSISVKGEYGYQWYNETGKELIK